MDNERQEERKPAPPKKAFELFSLLKKKQNITVRDDQYDFSMLLDAVRLFRDARYRFRVIARLGITGLLPYLLHDQ